MSIALLVSIQSPCELFPAKSMALQCFQTWPHRSFFIAIEQMVSKASKNTQRSTLFLLPIGEQCAALLKYKQFLWASERVLVPFCQSQQAELPGETARAFSLCAWTHEMQGKSPGPQTSHSGWKQLNHFYSREKKKSLSLVWFSYLWRKGKSKSLSTGMLWDPVSVMLSWWSVGARGEQSCCRVGGVGALPVVWGSLHAQFQMPSATGPVLYLVLRSQALPGGMAGHGFPALLLQHIKSYLCDVALPWL